MTAPDPSPPLSYMPQGYRHRQSKALGFAIFAIITGLVLAGCDWRGLRPPWWGQALIVGVPGVLAVLAYVLRWTAECRVEGDSLWFASENIRPVSVAIDDIVAIDRVDTGDTTHFEIVVRGKGRMKVGADVFEPINPLRKALHAVNPGIRFATYPGTHCRECGAAFFPADKVPGIRQVIRLARHGKCPACNRPLPKFGRFV